MQIKLSHGTYEDCSIVFAKYYGNRTAITIQCQGQPLCKATVNIPEVELPSNQVLIKNWSENEGILQSLIEAGIIEDTGEVVPTGFVEANICNLLSNPTGE